MAGRCLHLWQLTKTFKGCMRPPCYQLNKPDLVDATYMSTSKRSLLFKEVNHNNILNILNITSSFHNQIIKQFNSCLIIVNATQFQTQSTFKILNCPTCLLYSKNHYLTSNPSLDSQFRVSDTSTRLCYGQWCLKQHLANFKTKFVVSIKVNKCSSSFIKLTKHANYEETFF